MNELQSLARWMFVDKIIDEFDLVPRFVLDYKSWLQNSEEIEPLEVFDFCRN